MIKRLAEYIPFNEQEENDKKIMLEYMANHKDYLTRENKIAHFRAKKY